MTDSVSFPTTPSDAKSTKKNIFIISIAFVLIFTAYNAVTNLQSSANNDENVGIYSLAIISGSSIVSCLLFTNPVIYLCGYKWTIVIAPIGFLLFVGANIYPKAWIMYPASAFCGLVQAELWTAQSAYIGDLGRSRAIGDDETKVNKYFGIFYASFQTSEIWGDLITYLVLRKDGNETSQRDSRHCGANYLESEHHSLIDDNNQISIKTAAILYGIFMGLILISVVLVVMFLDQKQHSKKAKSKGFIHESLKQTTATFKQLTKLNQLLILPFSFWIGASEAFMWSIFISSYITCSVGIQYVGLVMISYGIVASICSGIFGYLGRFHNRPVLFAIASIVCYGSLITLLVWQPKSSQMYVLFILASLQGIGPAIWDPLGSALYETLFPDDEEAAFSSMWLGQHTGHLVVYLTAAPLRVRTSIILQIVYLTIALVGYVILEGKHMYKKRIRSDVLLLNDFT